MLIALFSRLKISRLKIISDQDQEKLLDMLCQKIQKIVLIRHDVFVVLGTVQTAIDAAKNFFGR
ncbi:hypothetical protein BpHYR1_004737 [Brachionus plicatilis]|uniref:Uncharacterized protein n=1 Tax=Brachionus plicatilis TaxID=10195 RepID=A0A3M7Q5C3_BRAPC|nr:hypothetical protein BpHYR1_004737 [Brachionus plicatilis]